MFVVREEEREQMNDDEIRKGGGKNLIGKLNLKYKKKLIDIYTQLYNDRYTVGLKCYIFIALLE